MHLWSLNKLNWIEIEKNYAGEGVIVFSVIMLSEIMLSVIMLSVIRLTVMAPRFSLLPIMFRFNSDFY